MAVVLDTQLSEIDVANSKVTDSSNQPINAATCTTIVPMEQQLTPPSDLKQGYLLIPKTVGIITE